MTTTQRTFLRRTFWTPPALLLATACSDARPGVTAKLDHGPTAPLGGVMTFTLTATSIWDAPDETATVAISNDARVRLSFTDGLQMLTAGWSSQVDQSGTASYSREVIFKANQP